MDNFLCKWNILVLASISAYIIQVNSQDIQRQPCTYTFHVPVDEFESQCVTSEIRQNLDEIRRENKKILSENAELKEQIENLFKVSNLI